MDETTARIPLRNRQREIVAYALVDAADEMRVTAQGAWSFDKGSGYARKAIQSMHRFILGLEIGDPRLGDHINRDRLDNRRLNLRIVSLRANGQNVPSQAGSSQFRGVSWYARDGVWTAQSTLNRRKVHLGRFTDERKAADVARQWRLANMPGAVD